MKKKYIKIKKDKAKENQSNAKKFNYGLAILKSILEFFVELHHNFRRRTTKNEIIIYYTTERYLILHVPSFFIMSFYLTCKTLLSLNPRKLLNRLMRLLIPYIGWPFIIFYINRFLNKKYNKKFPDSYSILKLQLLWGSRYLHPFWFLWTLIILTIAFSIIIFIFRKHSLFILHLILILSYVAQYSGFVYNKIFTKYEEYNRRVFGLFCESVPYAITGFTLGYYKTFDILKKTRIKSLILSMIIFKVTMDYNIFSYVKSVAFQGVKLNIQSVCVIFIFSLLPFDKIKNDIVLKFLTLITKNTAGVYYLHIPIHSYFADYIVDIKRGTFYGSIITYLICYVICFFGTLIFGKTPIKYLFC